MKQHLRTCHLCRNLVLLAVGGMAYCFVELLWRG